MTRVELRYVQVFNDRHGKTRYYFRRPGFKRRSLPGLPGSAEFMAAYQAALAGEAEPARQIGAERTAPGSMSALIAAYYASSEFQLLRASTQKNYRNLLETLRQDYGAAPVSRLEARHVRALIDARARTPVSANSLLKLLRILMAFAVERAWRRDNPTTGVKRLKVASDGFHTWTEAEIARFEATHPIGSRERLAFTLLLCTAQRRADVVVLGRQHVRGQTIHLRQSKTGALLALGIQPELEAVLAHVPGDQLTFLTTRQGRPFTPAGFTNWFRDAVAAAGLPKGCSAHGLRKAAARRLAEAGCSANEIAAVTGHASLAEVTRYTRAADQERLARAAVERTGSRTSTVKPMQKV